MSNTQRPPGIPRLGDKWLEFVGEGAANTVWALHFIDDSGGDAYTQHVRQLCDGFLLRIQKHTKGGDSAISATDQLAYVQETILPALNNDASLIVRQKLIQVTQPLIDECNALLAAMDDNGQPRPEPWHGHAERIFRGEDARDLLVAMTLRDCSLFFRYEDGEDGALRLLDFTLADLDKKTPAKIPSWQKTERELIDGGWYEGKQGCGMPNCYLKEGRAEDETRADVTRLKDASKLGVAYRE
ncbi:Gephyrin [Verticillium dahliae VDG1]|nr:Gephyrin [Verticillium dahliae VDG1]